MGKTSSQFHTIVADEGQAKEINHIILALPLARKEIALASKSLEESRVDDLSRDLIRTEPYLLSNSLISESVSRGDVHGGRLTTTTTNHIHR